MENLRLPFFERVMIGFELDVHEILFFRQFGQQVKHSSSLESFEWNIQSDKPLEYSIDRKTKRSTRQCRYGGWGCGTTVHQNWTTNKHFNRNRKCACALTVSVCVNGSWAQVLRNVHLPIYVPCHLKVSTKFFELFGNFLRHSKRLTLSSAIWHEQEALVPHFRDNISIKIHW